MRVIVKIIRRSLLGVGILVVVLGIAFAAYLESTLPSVEMLKDMRLQVPLRIYSSDGKLISEFGEAKRTPVSLDQVPQDLINAVLATEDRRFYDHSGVDLRGLLRAGMHLVTNVSVQQGGSTITMQVARNYFLTRKKTLIRKFSEILLALKIEKEFNKDEILEMYLNKIYLGKRAYGVAAAAEVYYGTTLDKLTLDQIAMIAGLPQAPSSVNPLHDKEAAYSRRKHVLDRMLSYEFITKEQYDKAVDAPLPDKYHGRVIELEAPYVAEMVRQELFSQYGEALYTLGYEIYTTIDSQKQNAANYALRRALLEYDVRHGYRAPKIRLKTVKKGKEQRDTWLAQLQEVPAYGHLMPAGVLRFDGGKCIVLAQSGQTIEIPPAGTGWARGQIHVGDVIYITETQQRTYKVSQVPEVSGALVALEPQNGAIMALVGGFDYAQSNFNRAAQAERQPGSNFKPFLYAAALDQGYTLASVFMDGPLTYVDPATGIAWSPKNASGRFYGPTTMRNALKRSQNLVTVRVLQAVGIGPAIDFIERFGFNRDRLPPVLSLALGVGTVTPLEIASGYAVFANGGNRVKAHLVKTIKDYQGNVVQEVPPPPAIPAIRPQVAYLITSVLQDAIQSGTGQRAKALGRKDISGKTGTTSDWMDAWFSGYNRDIIATAWVGFDEPKPLREYGSVAALPMWLYFMEEVMRDQPEDPPPMPPGIVSVRVGSSREGTLASDGHGYFELFTEETVPGEEIDPATTYFEQETEGGFEGVESLF